MTSLHSAPKRYSIYTAEVIIYRLVIDYSKIPNYVAKSVIFDISIFTYLIDIFVSPYSLPLKKIKLNTHKTTITLLPGAIPL